MALTLEQKIARKEQEVARLKEQVRREETGRKITIGGLVLSIAKQDPKRAQQLLEDIEGLTRKTDIERLEPIKKELQKTIRDSRP